MKIYVRYLGLILLERELTPGEYIVGRDKSSDLPLAHEYISRKHGRVYFENDQWFYQDIREGAKKRKKEPQKIETGKVIDLGHGIHLLNEQQLWDGYTEISRIHDISYLSHQIRENKKTMFWLGAALVLFVLASLSFRLENLWRKPLDTNNLLAFVRPKIVEFEHIKDEKLISDLKQYANLKDEDFQDRAGFCSGFVVAPNVVLTAFHCIRGTTLAEINTSFQIRTASGKLLKAAKVLGFDFKRDYLFLEVPGMDQKEVLRFSKSYTLGEKVFTVGNVGGEGIAIREGIMANTTKDPNDPTIEYIRYSAPASPGNSGGPLINSYGEVVGLVFARSFAENYNVGTAAEHLIQGKKNYVDQVSAKKVNVNFEGYLDFSTEELLLTFGYPFLPTWAENQEYPRMFQKIAFRMDAPLSLQDFSNAFSNNCNQATDSQFQEVLASMSKAGEREGRWKDLYTSDLKVLFSPDYFDSISYTYRQKEVIPSEISIHAPLGQRSIKEYVKKLNQLESALPPFETVVQQLDEDLAQKKTKPQFIYHMPSRGKRVMSFIPELMGAFVPKSAGLSWDDARKVTPEDISKIILGDEGITFATYGVPFLRPKSQKEFKIKKFLSTPTLETISDANGRAWTLVTWNVLDQTIESYCLASPQGYFCISRASMIQNQKLLKIAQLNFAKHFLSEYFIHTPFWRIDAFEDYLKKNPNASPIWSDVEIERGKTLRVKFKKLNVTADLGVAEGDMFRFVGGLTKSGSADPEWVSFGLDHIKKASTGGLLWCSITMEPAEQPQHPSLRDLHAMAKKNPAIKSNRFFYKQGGYQINMWSHCNPVEVKSETKPITPKYNVILPYAVKIRTP